MVKKVQFNELSSAITRVLQKAMANIDSELLQQHIEQHGEALEDVLENALQSSLVATLESRAQAPAPWLEPNEINGQMKARSIRSATFEDVEALQKQYPEIQQRLTVIRLVSFANASDSQQAPSSGWDVVKHFLVLCAWND